MAERVYGLWWRLALQLFAWLVALSALAALLAWIATGFQSLQGWASFAAFLGLGALLLLGGWRLLRRESPPRWLWVLLLGAALLRLAAGALWMVVLPNWGYQSQAERQGYVMADAYERDQAAWDLAQSEKSLLKAFSAYRKADQYGGLLFLSALLYRLLGGSVHQGLQMIAVTAAVSALAVPFTWAFTRRLWGETTARLAAFGLMLYPEAVLQGSSQMREAFLVTLAAAAFYGLVEGHQRHDWRGLLWILASLVLSLPFSPPFAGLLLITVSTAALAKGDLRLPAQGQRRRRLWLLLGGLGLLALAGTWLTWRQFAPEGVDNPIELVNWWLRQTAELQAILSRRASGWIQKIFATTPLWMHLPLLVLYGVVQPFLPAALIASSQAPVWRWIVLWRSVGWTLLLPFLAYAPILALRRGRRGVTAGLLSLALWLSILLASFRGGGDLWDNPRYRVVFAALQLALAAWVWVEQRKMHDPWMRRVLVGVALVIAWFLPWYLRRYTTFVWPVQDLFMTLGLGIASAILYSLWDSARGRAKTKNQE